MRYKSKPSGTYYLVYCAEKQLQYHRRGAWRIVNSQDQWGLLLRSNRKRYCHIHSDTNHSCTSLEQGTQWCMMSQLSNRQNKMIKICSMPFVALGPVRPSTPRRCALRRNGALLNSLLCARKYRQLGKLKRNRPNFQLPPCWGDIYRGNVWRQFWSSLSRIFLRGGRESPSILKIINRSR